MNTKAAAAEDAVRALDEFSANSYSPASVGKLVLVRSFIEAQAERICELEAELAEAKRENGRFADMLESAVADWRKLYAAERAERVRVEGILLNDVQAERQESDEHIAGLDTVIRTQDKTIGDLRAHIQRINVAYNDVVSRAESAEARVKELEAALADMLSGWRYIRENHGDLYGVGWDRCEQSAKAALRAEASA